MNILIGHDHLGKFPGGCAGKEDPRRFGQPGGVAAARYAQKADPLAAEIQTALREQGALIDGDDLPDPVAFQYS
jgi:hypothetical protein